MLPVRGEALGEQGADVLVAARIWVEAAGQDVEPETLGELGHAPPHGPAVAAQRDDRRAVLGEYRRQLDRYGQISAFPRGRAGENLTPPPRPGPPDQCP